MTRAMKTTGLIAGLLVFGYCLNTAAQDKQKPAKPAKKEAKAQCRVLTIHASKSEGRSGCSGVMDDRYVPPKRVSKAPIEWDYAIVDACLITRDGSFGATRAPRFP